MLRSIFGPTMVELRMVRQSRNTVGGLLTLILVGGLFYFYFRKHTSEGFSASMTPRAKPKIAPKAVPKPAPKKPVVTPVKPSNGLLKPPALSPPKKRTGTPMM